VTTFSTASRARLRRAGPSSPGRVRPRGTRDHPEAARAGAGPLPKPDGIGGHHADSGAGGVPRPTGGSPPGAAPPPGQQARTRRQAVPAATHPRGPRPRELTRPSSSRRAFSRRAKITVKSARYARVLRTALRAALDCDLPRQTLAPIRRTDLPRLDRPLRQIFQGKARHLSEGRGSIDPECDSLPRYCVATYYIHQLPNLAIRIPRLSCSVSDVHAG